MKAHEITAHHIITRHRAWHRHVRNVRLAVLLAVLAFWAGAGYAISVWL